MGSGVMTYRFSKSVERGPERRQVQFPPGQLRFQRRQRGALGVQFLFFGRLAFDDGHGLLPSRTGR